jgi:hypothetical protein
VVLSGLGDPESKRRVEAVRALRAAGADMIDTAELTAAFPPPPALRWPGDGRPRRALSVAPVELRNRWSNARMVLVYGGEAKTDKFFIALALGLAPLSLDWTLRCAKDGRWSQPEHALRLPRMLQGGTMLQGKAVVPVGEPAWAARVAAVLVAAGAHVLAELPHVDASGGAAQLAADGGAAPCVVLAEEPGDNRPRGKLGRARARRLPIVGMDWLKDSLLQQVDGGVPLTTESSGS